MSFALPSQNSRLPSTNTRTEELKECWLREHEAQHGDQDQPASQEDDDVVVESSRGEEGSDASDADSPSRSHSPETQPSPGTDAEGTQPEPMETDPEGTQSVASGGSTTVTQEEEQSSWGIKLPQWAKALPVTLPQ